MAEGGVKDTALALAAFPRHRHHAAVDPGAVLAGEGGGGQHLVRGIDMQVILFGAHSEISEPGRDRVFRFADVDGISG